MSPPSTKSTARASRPKKTPSEIAPGVFVGGWKDAEKFEGARFCVLDELPESGAPADGHVVIYDEAKDAPIVANLDRLVSMAEKARNANRPVLIFCGHGIRRSPLAGAWYLHRHEGVSLDAAYERVRAARPKVEHVRDWVGHWQVLDETDK